MSFLSPKTLYWSRLIHPLQPGNVPLDFVISQVHKEKLDKIPNALPNRTSTVIDIYGMVGVPEVDLIEHERQKTGIEGLLCSKLM